MNNIVAIIVTYNRLDILKQCIAAVLLQTIDCDVIVIDNASTDGTSEWMQESTTKNDRIKYFNIGSNIGGAGGFNYGLKKAVELKYDYMWIMDDDCISFPNSLEKLMDAATILDSVNYGYLSSVVLWTDGSDCKMNKQKIKNNYYVYSHLVDKGLIQVEQSTFVSLLIPKETIFKVGLPIKEFFIWGDDIEYTRRIAVRNDMPSFVVERSKVVHAMKENNGSSIATDSVERINRYKFAYRNENYLYRKEGIKGIAYYLAKCGLNIIRILIKAKNHRIRRICAILKNMVMGMWFNPTVEYIEGFENGKQQRVIN